MALGLLKQLTARLPANPLVRLVREHLPTRAVSQDVARGPIVAIEGVEDPLYFGLFSAVMVALRERHGVRGELILVHSISAEVGTGWKAALLRSVLLRWPLSMRWVRAYRPLVHRVGYRSVSLAHPLGDLVDALKSFLLWRRLRNLPGDFDLEIAGVPVGDLIVDSYLRFRPSPVFDKRDRFVLQLIWQAHRDVRRGLRYFGSARPDLYLTSYSTYLEHGIPVRVALRCGTPVRSFGSMFVVGKQLTLRDWFHTPDSDYYRRRFESLNDPARRLEEADAQLRKRFSGQLDQAMSYMRNSAYVNVAERVPPDMHGTAVVFLHDFYDSPHIYRDLVFEDFWSWVSFTIETLMEAGVPFYLKPHPNQIALSDTALQRLQEKYPQARLLSTRINVRQLAEAGIGCGITVYGSVGHELAYFGVPTIACARHPHVAFDFCRTARTREEYATYLRTHAERPLEAEEMRRQALMFYYMHNLYGDAGELGLRSDFISLWKAFHDTAPGAPALLALDKLRESPAFKALVTDMLRPIEAEAVLQTADGS